MAKLYVIRHGEPAAIWGEADDPGLSELGHKQAAEAASKLPTGLRTLSSPMRRCQETAAPYNAKPIIEPRVTEIPSPADAPDRRAWLQAAMAGTWSALPGHAAWRAELLDALRTDVDTVIFSHFVAINAAVGAAEGTDAVMLFQPGHASITVLETKGLALSLISLGAQNGPAKVG